MVSGFAHAPLTKAAIALTTAAALALATLDAKAYDRFQFTPHILTHHQYWQALTYHLAFPSSDRHVLAVVLLYYAGIPVERRLGSRRYAALLLTTALIHSALSLAWGALLSLTTPPAALHGGFLPGGPFGVLTALAATYFAAVPPLWTVRIDALELTDRIVVGIPTALLAGAQLPTSGISAALGCAAAYVYHTRLHSLDVPEHIAARLRTLRPLVGSLQLPARSSDAEYPA